MPRKKPPVQFRKLAEQAPESVAGLVLAYVARFCAARQRTALSPAQQACYDQYLQEYQAGRIATRNKADNALRQGTYKNSSGARTRELVAMGMVLPDGKIYTPRSGSRGETQWVPSQHALLGGMPLPFLQFTKTASRRALRGYGRICIFVERLRAEDRPLTADQRLYELAVAFRDGLESLLHAYMRASYLKGPKDLPLLPTAFHQVEPSGRRDDWTEDDFYSAL